MYIKNCRNSCNIKHCSPIENCAKLENTCIGIGNFSYTQRCAIGGTFNQNSLFHLNAQKNYVSLYVGNMDKIDGSRQLLKAFDMGKGCIRVKKSVEIKETGLNVFIAKTIQYLRKGGNTGC